MKISRRLAVLVTPVVAALAIGGVAVASNAWHTSTTIHAAGHVGTVLPVTATATIGDIYPGQPMTYTVTYTNPNSFNVNALTLQATDLTFTDLAVYPVVVDPTFTDHRSYPTLWSSVLSPSLTEAQAEVAFDWTGSVVLSPGTHTVTLTADHVADVTWADALKQGSPVSLNFWVDEAAF